MKKTQQQLAFVTCIACCIGLIANAFGGEKANSDKSETAAAVSDLDLLAGNDPDMRYFLIGGGAGITPPPHGFKLLLVLPGGDGSADFHAFVKNIYSNALSTQYLVAELVAKQWTSGQFDQLVWPTDTNPWPGMRFSTEAFALAVIADVKTRYKIDDRFLYTLGWSSGGPPCYALSLKLNSPIRGSFIAMSVFFPSQLPPLSRAAGKAYYLLHSPTDFIPISQAQQARDQLKAQGATTKLTTYSGGHGWNGDVYGMQRAGFQWLEQQAPPEPENAIDAKNWNQYAAAEKK